ncbi:MAG: hypothetical protein PHS53_00585 [Candidatus Pacebacteria bacterium]|nr:hypothetical protein [Candidatus Paceibacterota bacterium]MDD5356633.1 hypothetical protein [Candidatus Paceibacterota bacterium]
MFSPAIQRLVDDLKHQSGKTGSFGGSSDAFIKVNKLTGKAGAFYEKVRYFVDYKEEHTIRRSAIERIIKRKVMIEIDNNVGLSLLEELVGGGYLPNDRVGADVAKDIQRILNRFLIVKKHIGPKLLRNLKLKSRLINLAATEIDLFLFPRPNDNLLVEAFYSTVKGSIKYSGELSNMQFGRQLYIACRRLLLQDDDPTVFYALWLKSVPEWPVISSEADLQKLNIDFFVLIKNIILEIEDPIRFQIQAKLRNHGLYFSVLKEIIDKYGAESEQVLSDKHHLDGDISEVLDKKYKKENNRIKKSGKRAIVYVFCTKIILAFLLELPYELFYIHSVNYVAFVTNILFHPFLLFLMTRNIKPLGEKNTKKITEGIHKVLYSSDVKKMYVKPSTSGILLDTTFFLLYGLLFLVSFGCILWVLLSLGFNVVGILLFLTFLTFVSYFGLRIRYNAERWRIRDEDEKTLTLLWNVFTFPIVRMGRWLSVKFASVNVFVFVMDFLIEVPFKLVLATSDGFLSFLKEKRDETY